jgi:uncharacterized coiled-coil DUF342 family protein
MSALAPISKSVAAARRRLFLHALVNWLAGCWAGALALGIGWFLAEPWVVEAPAAWLKWVVFGGLAAVSTVVAVWRAVRVTPTRARAALELDQRFELKERVTTALGLSGPELATPAGQAVAADAAERAAGLKVGTRFPVALRWHSAAVPVLAAALVGVTFFYHPTVGQTADGADDPAKKTADAAKLAEQKKNPTPFTAQNKPAELAARGDKSKALKELEESLNEMMKKYDKDSDKDAEKAREKATELTQAAERTKKFTEDKYQKLARLEKQLEQLDRLTKDEEFQKGPAKELNDALAKGDLQKAAKDLDELKKKVQDKKLSDEEKKQLAQQLEKMKEEIKRQAKNQERQQQLKELIQKARQEGRDAESLERELKALEDDQKMAQETTKQLAEKFQKAQEAMKQGNFEEAAKELEQAGQALKDIEADLKDLEDAEDYLQRLKEEAKKACKNCNGQCDSDKVQEKDWAEWSEFGRPGAGRRAEESDTTNSVDKRHRGLFDPKGKKSYGGATRGPAFKKATTAELGPAISEAAQEAPKATDDPRFPRDARETVKEYFQKLGDQTPGGNK